MNKKLNEVIEKAKKEAIEYYINVTKPLDKILKKENKYFEGMLTTDRAFYEYAQLKEDISNCFVYRLCVQTLARSFRITAEAISDKVADIQILNNTHKIIYNMKKDLVKGITKDRVLLVRQPFQTSCWKDPLTHDNVYIVSCRVASIPDPLKVNSQEDISRILEEQPVSFIYTKEEGVKAQ